MNARGTALTYSQEQQIREIVQEEIAAYMEARQDMEVAGSITVDGERSGEDLLHAIEDAARRMGSLSGSFSYRDYLRDRDEPPAAPPPPPPPINERVVRGRTINHTEPL